MFVEPYLFFNGRCEEALNFYRRTLGAEVTSLMRNKECPEHDMGVPGGEEKIMHCSFRIGDTTLMGSDGRCQGSPVFQGFSLTLNVADEAEAERVFAALSDGGTVHMPLTQTFYASRFGMLADRFGLPWMIMAAKEVAS
jgi:PhnB protein